MSINSGFFGWIGKINMDNIFSDLGRGHTNEFQGMLFLIL